MLESGQLFAGILLHEFVDDHQLFGVEVVAWGPSGRIFEPPHKCLRTVPPLPLCPSSFANRPCEGHGCELVAWWLRTMPGAGCECPPLNVATSKGPVPRVGGVHEGATCHGPGWSRSLRSPFGRRIQPDEVWDAVSHWLVCVHPSKRIASID